MIPTPTRLDRHVAVLYCDDVRQEVGNKLSFVGVYKNTLILPSFPAKLLKLCMVIEIAAPKSKIFEVAEISIFNGDSIIGEVKVELPTPGASAAPQLGLNGAPTAFVSTTAILPFENFEVDSATTLRIRVKFDDGEILPGPALIIADQATAQRQSL